MGTDVLVSGDCVVYGHDVDICIVEEDMEHLERQQYYPECALLERLDEYVHVWQGHKRVVEGARCGEILEQAWRGPKSNDE